MVRQRPWEFSVLQPLGPGDLLERCAAADDGLSGVSTYKIQHILGGLW